MNQSPESSLDLNSTDQKTLITRLEISAEQAKRILERRPYQSIEQLSLVEGLDPETLARITPHLMVEPLAQVLTPETPLDLPAASSQPTDEALIPPAPAIVSRNPSWKTNFLLILVLLIGAYFRLTGINWDQNHHQHPDERFITMVAEQIRGVNGLSAYFDTVNSTLNPLKFGSYTYGMLPLFLTRFVAEWVQMAKYDQITLVGRTMSGLFDLAAAWMLYLLGKRLYDRRTGLLAASLYVAAVLPIQLSHYFAVDSFSTVFVIASFYFGLLALPLERFEEKLGLRHLIYFIIFGCLVGLAGACKVSVLPVFGIIILAGLVRLIMGWRKPGFRSLLFTILAGWILSGLLTALIFRIFQPYAFMGPGFFGIDLNKNWLKVLTEVTDQVAGKSEWPPNHQWTNQPFSYAWTNMVLWGLGLPLGLAGWAGWAWAGWRIWKGDWQRHLLPFAWVLAYFVWQNAQFWRYMRYFLPIYPFLILFAAWALINIFDLTSESRKSLLAHGKNFRAQFADRNKTWKGAAGALAIGVILIATYIYAFAFTRIYNRPISRIEASRWMFENIPAPLNLKVQSVQETKSYPIPIADQFVIGQSNPGISDIFISRNGIASEITAPNISSVGVNFYIRLTRDEQGEDLITDGRLMLPDNSTDTKLTINFASIDLIPGQPLYLHFKITSNSLFSISGLVLRSDNTDNPFYAVDYNLQDQPPGEIKSYVTLQSDYETTVNHLDINQFEQSFVPGQSTFKLSLFKEGDDQNPLAVSSQKLDFPNAGLQLSPTFKFTPVQLIKGSNYKLRYEVLDGGPLRIMSDSYTLETSWDDFLPLSVDKTTDIGGIYQSSNLELFEPDTPEKRALMIDILSKSDYIVIPSNRAYDAMPRLPLRYPLTLKYFQTLFDCDCSGDDMENRVASLEPPFKSPLGFDLVKTFESNPGIGPFSFNDQTADESFTVYDHPKVLIFKKSSDFSTAKLTQLLDGVDLEQVIFQVPLSYTRAPLAFQLPKDRLAAQTVGGTWSSMFSRAALLNANENLGTLAWYVFLLLLGWVVFPLIFTAFPGLPDRGYPLARMAGLIVIAWLAWILGSYKILPFTQATIAICIGLAILVNGLLAYFKRRDLSDYLRNQWKHILATELLFMGIFLFSIYLRMNNPDLWQPWLGGEKPMDFAFFNTTLKAVYFPPENPWFSGHYLNYYYYGYVLAAIPTKLLGILPSFAYNLILPGWFAMSGVGVFCTAYNLVTGLSGIHQEMPLPLESEPASQNPAPLVQKNSTRTYAYLAGIFALVAVMFLGNLYMLREFWQYLPEAVPDNAGQKNISSVLNGALQVITGQASLPGDDARWYFESSRPILHNGPDTPIAEFPYFTFLFADLHTHLLTMPIYGLALGWLLSLLLIPFPRMKKYDQLISLLMASLIFGSLRASHTWDFPTFLGLGFLIVLLNVWQTRTDKLKHTLGVFLAAELAFVGLTLALYAPYAEWFKTEYASVELWGGARTPLLDYLGVFGLSLFVMLSLIILDFIPEIKNEFQWKSASIFRKLRPFLLILLTIAVTAALWLLDYQVLSLCVPLLIGMAYLVFFKPGLNLFHRAVWFLFAVGISITVVVEVIVLKGDVGRSNTVFRLYNQAWLFMGLATSTALLVIWSKISAWKNAFKITWIVLFGLLFISAASYPLVATPARLANRWPDIPNPPITLDGAAFMLGDTSDPNVQLPAFYNDDNRKINLSLDYASIKFMQENIPGSPVIVEGHTQEYRWGSRYSIYTGLPSVIGWNWHVRQHNSLLDGAIIDRRISEVDDFYNNPEIASAVHFLKKYQVQYIVLGGLERAYYTPEGIHKFQAMIDQGLLSIEFGDNTSATSTILKVQEINK